MGWRPVARVSGLTVAVAMGVVSSACGPEPEQEPDEALAHLIATWQDATTTCVELGRTLQTCDPPPQADAAMCVTACMRIVIEYQGLADAAVNDEDFDAAAAQPCADASLAWATCIGGLSCETFQATCEMGTNPCATEEQAFVAAC